MLAFMISVFSFPCWSESKESDVLAAFHAEQKSYLEKKKAAQKRKGEGRDEQVVWLTYFKNTRKQMLEFLDLPL